MTLRLLALPSLGYCMQWLYLGIFKLWRRPIAIWSREKTNFGQAKMGARDGRGSKEFGEFWQVEGGGGFWHTFMGHD